MTSWWVGHATRESFAAAHARELPRMLQQCPRWIDYIGAQIVGWGAVTPRGGPRAQSDAQ